MIRISTPVILMNLVFAGCMSSEDAANTAFNDLLGDLARQYPQAAVNQAPTEAVAGKGDWFGIGDAAGKFAVCKVLRWALGDNPADHHVAVVMGDTVEASAFHLNAQMGTEVAFDLTNYQAASFGIYGGGYSMNLASVRGGTYGGAMVGYHTSVLDLAGPRAIVDVDWNIPLVRNLLGEVNFKGMQTMGDMPMTGGAVGVKYGIKFSPADLALLAPTLSVKGAWFVPGQDPILYSDSTVDLSQRDADLGAKLNTNCPGAAFVQYDGPADTEDTYHTARGKAMGEAILRSSWFEGPLAAALARVAIAMGVARDHGGFAAVCGNGEVAPEGGLDPSPVPQPRCPNLPTLNPHDPEGTGPTTTPEARPQGSFVAPREGVTVQSGFRVEIAVADANSQRIERVALRVDGGAVHEWTAAPYTAEIQLQPGSYALEAVAEDDRGTLHVLDTVGITVQATPASTTTPANDTTPTNTPANNTGSGYDGTTPANTAGTGYDGNGAGYGNTAAGHDPAGQQPYAGPSTGQGCSVSSGRADSGSLLLLLGLVGLVAARRRRR